MRNLLLWEKYRPKHLKHVILLPRIANVINGGVDNNMIFYGSPGTGKTTVARILARQNNSIELSGKLGVDVISEKIKAHFDGLSLEHKNDVKMTFLDEFDKASAQMQDGLKTFVEEYPNARFIFATNHIDKITDELKSRFDTVLFDPIDDDEREYLFSKQVSFVRGIAKKEGSDTYKDKELFETMVTRHFPDLRASIVTLQRFLKTGEISVESETSSDRISLYDFVLNGRKDPIGVYDFVMDNYFTRYDDAFKYLSRPFFEYLREMNVDVLMKKGALIVSKQKEYNETIGQTIDPIIHLVNYVMDLQAIVS